MKKLINISIILGFFLVSHTLHAATNPYERSGVIEEIRLDEGLITISDEVFSIIPQVLVNKRSKQKIGINNLSINLPIGYNVQLTGDTLIINEVWILDKTPEDDSVNDD